MIFDIFATYDGYEVRYGSYILGVFSTVDTAKKYVKEAEAKKLQHFFDKNGALNAAGIKVTDSIFETLKNQQWVEQNTVTTK
jgi:hypothetical protein